MSEIIIAITSIIVILLMVKGLQRFWKIREYENQLFETELED